MDSYNYTEFSTGDYDFDNFEGPVVGSKAPDFQLTTSDGKGIRLLDFDGELLVLEMGSITCPLFQGRRAGMEALSQDARVSARVLYIREAHSGADIQGHANFEDKQACASRLNGDDRETRTILVDDPRGRSSWTILVDDFEGTAHRAYGGMPNSVFVINRNGCVVFRSAWNNASATAQAVASLLSGKAVTTKSYSWPVPPTVVLQTLRRGGKGS
ncbi:MAG: redoxin domain-containing protein [Nannocystaceae bacterium]|nr:redoxin domain-containing protein [Nannocystaceae bacterium]